MFFTLLAASALFVPEASIKEAFDGRTGALVLIDCANGETLRYNPPLCAENVAPCSTFKIWNTAIGLETGILTGADQPFWKWDGVKRSIEPWNGDLTLRQAYAASCVPAYQALARQIGPERMDAWIAKLGYGNRDTSSGNDVFWLPAPGRRAILISADEQAALLRRLATGDIPFSAQTREILKDIMTAKVTGRGTLYGKTGTSGNVGEGNPRIGWFVGYIVSGQKTLAFACLLLGPDATGKEARAVVERAMTGVGLL